MTRPGVTDALGPGHWHHHTYSPDPRDATLTPGVTSAHTAGQKPRTIESRLTECIGSAGTEVKLSLK